MRSPPIPRRATPRWRPTAWLLAGRARPEDARTTRDRADAAVTQARARLNAARLADEAVRRRLDALAAAARAEGLKREQAELDELARRPRPAG